MAYHPGFPDFLLLFERRTIYSEVKWLPDKARPKQLVFLQELQDEGYPTCLLGYGQHHGLKGWTIWTKNYHTLIGKILRPGEGQLWVENLGLPEAIDLLLR